MNPIPLFLNQKCRANGKKKERMAREIRDFVNGKMDWDAALAFITKIAESEELIDYLLREIELYELLNQRRRKLLSWFDLLGIRLRGISVQLI